MSQLSTPIDSRADWKMRDDPRGRGGRPSVSEIVVELLTRHRDELDALD